MPTNRRLRAGEVELSLLEAGEGGRPLLLVHGFTGAGTDFADHLDALADRGWHVVAPDNRGHGASDKPVDEADYDLDRFAADVLALLDALGWARTTLLGHSMGGMISQVVALQAPERLDGLILMDTSHGPVDLGRDLVLGAVHVVRTYGMDDLADRLATMDGGALETPAARRLKETRPDLAELDDRKLRSVSPAMYAAMATELLDQEDRLPALAGLAVPTLVIVGEQDRPFVGPSERMAATIPGARLEVIPDGGHSPQLEASEAWWKALTGFLDELPIAT